MLNKRKGDIAMDILESKCETQMRELRGSGHDADQMVLGLEALLAILEEDRKKVWSKLYVQGCEEREYLTGYIAGIQHAVNVAHKVSSKGGTNDQ